MQGAFVSDEEIERVIKFLKTQGEPDYNYTVTEDTRTGGTAFHSDDSDPLLEDAIKIVIDSGKASTSFLQRRMRVGYSRAARIVDIMEEMGIIGPQNGSKARDVLVERWPLKDDSEDEPAESDEDEYEDDEELDQDNEGQDYDETESDEEDDEYESDEEEYEDDQEIDEDEEE